MVTETLTVVIFCVELKTWRCCGCRTLCLVMLFVGVFVFLFFFYYMLIGLLQFELDIGIGGVLFVFGNFMLHNYC